MVNKKAYNILVFPGGTEIGLEIWNALHQCKDIRLFAAGANVSSHASCVYAKVFTVPSIFESGWIESLNKVVVENSIDYIFPAYDDIIVALASNSNRIKAKIVSSPLETCLMTRSKTATYRHLQGFLPVPAIHPTLASVDCYPVFVKPDKGQGSQDTHLVRTKERLQELLGEDSGRIAVEHLPGEEYTVDCFSDRDQGVLFCSGRERVRTRSGISMNSRIAAQQDVFLEYAKIIADRITLWGGWFFQVKRDRHGVLKLLEIAPRIAGTMALHRVQGINFPLLSIYEQERIPFSILRNDGFIEIDRALANRYRHQVRYGSVYFDLDDTLILDGKINVTAMAFVYQCINQGKKIKLLTKHQKDLDVTLAQYRLAGLWDEVIHISKTEAKADYIKERDAILIDDSFSERKSASDRLGIATFDCSMLELLLDERR